MTSLLPKFLIIGSMKCGTSSLHYYINQHPEIDMSFDKENHYFSVDTIYNNGIDWYKGLFPKSNNVIGETSVSYADFRNYPEAPKRILNDLGQQVKFIYIVRDPFERVKSHYVHNYAEGRLKLNINQYINSNIENTIVIDYCRYYSQIQSYLKYFDLSQFLILSSEELMNNRTGTLKKVFKFLGVNENYYTENFEKIKHKSKSKKQYNKFGFILRHTPLIWRYVNKIPFTGSKITNPVLNASSKDKIKTLLNKEIEQFESLTKRKFSEWKEYNSHI